MCSVRVGLLQTASVEQHVHGFYEQMLDAHTSNLEFMTPGVNHVHLLSPCEVNRRSAAIAGWLCNLLVQLADECISRLFCFVSLQGCSTTDRRPIYAAGC